MEKYCLDWKKILKVWYKKIFRILFFSTYCSSEHEENSFDSFVENSEPHVRKVLLKVRLHNEKRKKMKKSVSSTCFWTHRKQFWQPFRRIFAESQKMFGSNSEKNLRIFQKRFFWLKCSYQFLENSFHTFARKEFENSEKVLTKIQKEKKNFSWSCWLYIIVFGWTLRKQFCQICRIFFAKSLEKICSKLKKKQFSKIFFFSSKWSSEHVGTSFDSFLENFEPHVRKFLLKIRLHNKNRENWKSLFLQLVSEHVDNSSDNLSVDFLPKVRKCLDPIPKKLENFSKKIFFYWSVSISS